jgi:hypothetical protein
MNILNAVERGAFDSPPVFNSLQRKQYFDFPSKLRRFVAGLRSPAYRVGMEFDPQNWWTKWGAILGAAQSPKIQSLKGG